MSAMRLTERDAAILREEKRRGYLLAGVIIMLGILFTVVFKTLQLYDTIALVGIDILIIAASLLTSYLMNRKYEADLQYGFKCGNLAVVEKKVVEASGEAGSGNIPLLGDLFPKFGGQKTRERNKHLLIIGGTRYEVDEGVYSAAREGAPVVIYRSAQTGTLLGIEPV